VIRGTPNANASEAPRLYAALIPALMLLSRLPQAQISIKTSTHLTTMHVLSPMHQQVVNLSGIMQAWRVCGLHMVFRVGELTDMTYRIRRISWPEEGVNRKEDMDASDQAKKINFANGGQAPKFLAHKPSLLQP